MRDGKDGLLFPPGDAKALADAMRRMAQEKGLHAKLVRGIAPVKSVEAQVDELVPLYDELVRNSQTHKAAELPPSLREPGRRYDELARLPLRQLYRTVLDGLGQLSVFLAGDASEHPSAGRAVEVLATGSKTKVLLEDLKRERDWLRGSLASQERTIQALEGRLEWRESELTQRQSENEWLRQTVEGDQTAIEWLRSTLESSQKGLEWLKKSTEDKEKSIGSLRKENEWLHSIVRGFQEKQQTDDASVEGLTKENEWLRTVISDYEAKQGTSAASVESLGKENEWLRSLVADAQEKQAASETSIESLGKENEWLRGVVEGLEGKQAASEVSVESLGKENEWLRSVVEGLEEKHGASERSRASLEKENRWLRGVVSGKDDEIIWLRDALGSKESEAEARAREVEWLRDSLIAHEHDLAWHQEKRRALEEACARLGTEKDDLSERLEDRSQELREGWLSLSNLALQALEVQKRVAGNDFDELLETFRKGPQMATIEELSARVSAGNQRLLDHLDELARRRREMEAATEEASRRLARILLSRTGLGRRVRGWSDSGASDPLRSNGSSETPEGEATS